MKSHKTVQRHGDSSNATPVQRKAGAGSPSGSPGWAVQAQSVYGNNYVQAIASEEAEGGAAGDVQAIAAQGVSGGGAPLPHGDAIQASFGSHDVSGVRAHVGGAASEASAAIGASAYATGGDVAFDGAPGLHTAAHEAAHVVQQRAGVQLEGGVGRAGDVYEKNADAAADAVVQGESAEGILDQMAGPGGGQGVQRQSAPGGAVQAEDGGVASTETTPEATGVAWIRDNIAAATTTSTVLMTRVRDLSDTDKAALAGDHTLSRKISAKLTSAENNHAYVRLLPMALKWQIDSFQQGGVAANITTGQYATLIFEGGDQEFAELKGWAEMYNIVLANAPLAIRPRDRVETVNLPGVTLTNEQLKLALNDMNAEDTLAVRSDVGLVAVIAYTLKGSPADVLAMVRQLDMNLKWKIYYIGVSAGVAGSISNEDWCAMVAEAPTAEIDALRADAQCWQIFVDNCPGAETTIALFTQNAATIVPFLQASAANVQQVIDAVGGLATLSWIARSTTPIPGIQALETHGKLTAVLSGVSGGGALGQDGKYSMKLLFDNVTNDVTKLSNIFTKRFGKPLVPTTINGMTPSTGIAWDAVGIRRMYQLAEQLPPSAVEDNNFIQEILRNSTTDGSAGYSWWTADAAAGGDRGFITMGYSTPNETPATAGVSNGGPLGSQVNLFNAAFRHEIGHAVDRRLQAQSGYPTTAANAGQWQKYANATAFVDAIIAEHSGGMASAYPTVSAGDRTLYRTAMVNAVSNNQTWLAAYRAAKGDNTIAMADPGGPVSAVWALSRWANSTSPWYNIGSTVVSGTRRFWDGGNDLVSFKDSARSSYRLSDYQWRHPSEWFAEVYSYFYSSVDTGNAPGAEHNVTTDASGTMIFGQSVRSIDSGTADWFAATIDQDFSLPQMTGQVTAGGGAGFVPGQTQGTFGGQGTVGPNAAAPGGGAPGGGP